MSGQTFTDRSLELFTDQPVFDAPEAVLQRFWADWKQFNDFVFGEHHKPDAAELYTLCDRMLARLTVSGAQHQGVSIGSEALHDPALEEVTSTVIDGETARVRSHARDRYGDGFDDADYLYELVRGADGWKLAAYWNVTFEEPIRYL
ncbi:hypothetical protein [Aliiroseovarius subalbicans]|uniref:hypothetical protein n=1 Tax=Aliiroseovarius subalbicans TaxID=2925840 RepID=UPI001F5AD508|nr:hypothetical protein [Aliiroseovarius subalbicans]MCI2399495.1 hypothetical protein [Aliiroseovarius subalbicans]